MLRPSFSSLALLFFLFFPLSLSFSLSLSLSLWAFRVLSQFFYVPHKKKRMSAAAMRLVTNTLHGGVHFQYCYCAKMHRQIGGCGSSSSLATPASSLYNCRLLRPQTIMAPPPAKRGRHSRIIVSSASSSSLHPSTEMKEVAVLGSGAAGLRGAEIDRGDQKKKKKFF